MLRSGGQPLLMARRAVAAAAQRPRLNRSAPVNGRLRLAPRHRRLSTTPPTAGGKEPPPPVVMAEEVGAKAAAEGAAPPLPEVPVLEAPAGACVDV